MRSTTTLALVLAAALAATGCSLIKTSSSFSTSSSPSSAPAPSSGGGGGGGGGGGVTSADADWRIVPDLRGKTFEEARAIVLKAGFDPTPEENTPVRCDAAPSRGEGKISCQDPDPGEKAKSYKVITVKVWRPPPPKSSLDKTELATLRGLTLEQAKAQLKKLGHTGRIKTTGPISYVKGCADDTVCYTNRDSGMGKEEDIELTLNKKAAIGGPPPE